MSKVVGLTFLPSVPEGLGSKTGLQTGCNFVAFLSSSRQVTKFDHDRVLPYRFHFITEY